MTQSTGRKKKLMAIAEARRLRVGELRKSGMTMAAIGRVVGVTPGRIRQLLSRTKMLEARGKDGEEDASGR